MTRVRLPSILGGDPATLAADYLVDLPHSRSVQGEAEQGPHLDGGLFGGDHDQS